MQRKEPVTNVEGSTWFDHMTGYLNWKVIGPDITNPFKTPHTLGTLNRMASQRDFLCQFVSIRCMCDGYEVMIISNPEKPRVLSNHPCISNMEVTEIVDYLHRHNLDDFIASQIDQIEQEIREHVTQRREELRDEQSKDGSTRITPKANPKKNESSLGVLGGGSTRIVRR